MSVVLLEVAECDIFAEDYLTEHHCKVTFVLCMDQTLRHWIPMTPLTRVCDLWPAWLTEAAQRCRDRVLCLRTT